MKRRGSFRNDLFGGVLIDAVMGGRRRFENRVPIAKLQGARFEVKNAAQNDTADLYIYGDIAFYDITAQMVAEALSTVSAKTLVVHINSCGGDVFDGVAIYNTLRAYAKRNSAKIEVHIEALAGSIASVIAEAGDEVVIARNAMMMIHRASGGCWGDADDMAAMGSVLTAIENDMIIPTYAHHTGMSPADLMALMKAETWMNAQTCVEKGFADRLEDDSAATALLRPHVFNNVPAELLNAADWMCGAARDLPVAKKDAWDGAAAKERMLDAAGFNGSDPDPAKAKQGFLAYEASEPKLKGSYKLPFADVIDGKLTAVDQGWIAAEQRLDGTDIPQSVKDEAKAVIEAYEKKAGEDDDEKTENATRIARMRTRLAALACEV